jgi:hypothetical protein
MNESDIEMHEQNDSLEHAAGEVDARVRDDSSTTEVGEAETPSSTYPEIRRNQVPDEP